MRRRSGRSRRGLIAAAGLIIVVALAGLFSAGRYGAPAPAPRAALDRVAEKNRKAATIAAASQRAEAAAATDAANALAEAGAAN